MHKRGGIANSPIPPHNNLMKWWWSGYREYEDGITTPSFSEEFATLPGYCNKFETADYETLAKGDPAFKEVWEKAQGRLDFQDPSTVMALNKAILKVDFNLTLELPDDRLCPPIPNRFNYVAWIQRLIDATGPDYDDFDKWDPNRRVVGLDIGTGASAIYTMLCLQTRPKWIMCATDIDKKSFDSAVRNLAINRLATQAKMIQTIESNPLIPIEHFGEESLDFTMCNPPFFSSADEMHASMRGDSKAAPPSSICTGAEVEMVCPGGDLGFATRILEESLVLREKVGWYTSLLGKLSSAKTLIALLKNHGINNYVVGDVKVSKTSRWLVGWSFRDRRPPNHVNRGPSNPDLHPLSTEYTLTIPTEQLNGSLAMLIAQTMTILDLKSWTWDQHSVPARGIGEATRNVWNRAYRRQKEREQEARRTGTMAMNLDAAEGTEKEEEEKVALVFKIRVWEAERRVTVDWLRGLDPVVWESFCTMLQKRCSLRR